MPSSERRADTRLKLKLPVEIRFEDNPAPYRTATSDLSLSGCYIETIYPFPVGATLELKLDLSETLLILATVATKDPQVGNGLHFEKMLPEDVEVLQDFLESAQREAEEGKDSDEKNGADIQPDALLEMATKSEESVEIITDPDLVVKDELEKS